MYLKALLLQLEVYKWRLTGFFQGVDFDFEYSAVAAHAVVLLGEDPRLREMRYSSIYELLCKQKNLALIQYY